LRELCAVTCALLPWHLLRKSFFSRYLIGLRTCYRRRPRTSCRRPGRSVLPAALNPALYRVPPQILQIPLPRLQRTEPFNLPRLLGAGCDPSRQHFYQIRQPRPRLAEQIAASISREGFFVRVPAGKQFTSVAAVSLNVLIHRQLCTYRPYSNPEVIRRIMKLRPNSGLPPSVIVNVGAHADEYSQSQKTRPCAPFRPFVA
jgi:hypothetical protein